jgi:hypothetical protein
MIESKFDVSDVATFDGDLDELIGTAAPVTVDPVKAKPPVNTNPIGKDSPDEIDSVMAEMHNINRGALVNALPLLNKVFEVHAEQLEKDSPADLFDEICSVTLIELERVAAKLGLERHSWEQTKLFELMFTEAARVRARTGKIANIEGFADQLIELHKADSLKALVGSFKQNLNVTLDDKDVGLHTYSQVFQKIVGLDKSLDYTGIVGPDVTPSEASARRSFVLSLTSDIAKAASTRFALTLFGADRAISERALIARSFDMVVALIRAEQKQDPELEYDTELFNRIYADGSEAMFAQIDSIGTYTNSIADAYAWHVKSLAEQGLSNGKVEPPRPVSELASQHRIELNALKVLSWAAVHSVKTDDLTGEKYQQLLGEVLANTPVLANTLFGLHNPFIRAKSAEMLAHRATLLAEEGKTFDPKEYIGAIENIVQAQHFSHFSRLMGFSQVFKEFVPQEHLKLPVAFVDSMLSASVSIERTLNRHPFFKESRAEVRNEILQLILKIQRDTEPAVLKQIPLNDAVYTKRSLISAVTHHSVRVIDTILANISNDFAKAEAKGSNFTNADKDELILESGLYDGVRRTVTARMQSLDRVASGFAQLSAEDVSAQKSSLANIEKEITVKEDGHAI